MIVIASINSVTLPETHLNLLHQPDEHVLPHDSFFVPLSLLSFGARVDEKNIVDDDVIEVL